MGIFFFIPDKNISLQIFITSFQEITYLLFWHDKTPNSWMYKQGKKKTSKVWFFLFLLLSVFDIQNWFNESYLFYIPGKYKNRGKQILFLVFIRFFFFDFPYSIDISCILFYFQWKGWVFRWGFPSLGNVDLNINIIYADVNRIIKFSSPFF